MKIRKTKFIIGGALILTGIGILLATFLPNSFQYYVTVDELKSRETELLGKELKVAGKVQSDSVVKSEKDLLTTFRVENGTEVVAVTYTGALPDMFKEGADVVVTGTIDAPGHLNATHVLAKCASRYEEKLHPTYESK